MLPLLAQLVAPPLQPGPIRLPGADQQRSLPVSPAPAGPQAPAPVQPAAPGATASQPRLRGFNPYSPAELSRILADCSSNTNPEARLNLCATALGSRLFADGYINSRVIPQPNPPPGELEVVPGKIEAIQVVSSSQRLQRRLLRLLKPLQGSVLHLPTLTASSPGFSSYPASACSKPTSTASVRTPTAPSC